MADSTREFHWQSQFVSPSRIRVRNSHTKECTGNKRRASRNNFSRILITVIVFLAAFYFVSFSPVSLMPLGLRYFVPIGCAAIAAWYVWTKSTSQNASKEANMARHIIYGALVTGGIAFCAGFFGPILFNPSANQGPLLGIFITGPLGLLVGGIGGFVYWLAKKGKSTD